VKNEEGGGYVFDRLLSLCAWNLTCFTAKEGICFRQADQE